MRGGPEVTELIMHMSAREIADEADDVLHEKPADLAKAYGVLVKLRVATITDLMADARLPLPPAC